MYKYAAPLRCLVSCDVHENSLTSLWLTCCSCEFLHLGWQSQAIVLWNTPVVLNWASWVAAGIYFHLLKVILMTARVGSARDQPNYKLALKPRAGDARQSHSTGLSNRTSLSLQDSDQQCHVNDCNHCVTKACTQSGRSGFSSSYCARV